MLNKKKVAKILSPIITCLFLAYFLILIAFFQLEITPLLVTSNSMSPYFSSGDLLLATRQEQYQIGDVISFRPELNNDGIVTHRINGTIENKFQTKGDANSNIDQKLVDFAQIIGSVELIIPKIGFVIIFLRSNYFSAVIVSTIIFLLFRLITAKLSIKNKFIKNLE